MAASILIKELGWRYLAPSFPSFDFESSLSHPDKKSGSKRSSLLLTSSSLYFFQSLLFLVTNPGELDPPHLNRRGSKEDKLHLSNLLQHARRRPAKRVILFVDHAPCHKTKNMKRFIGDRPMLRVKLLTKRTPNLNPIESQVNKALKPAVCINRSHSDIDGLTRAGRRFLTRYKQTYGN